MLDPGGPVLHFDIGNRVAAAVGPDQQAVALRVVARTLGLGLDAYQPAIGVLPMAGGDALGDDGRAGVAPEMDHLGAGIGLLTVVGDSDGVELADRVVALEDDA